MQMLLVKYLHTSITIAQILASSLFKVILVSTKGKNKTVKAKRFYKHPITLNLADVGK